MKKEITLSILFIALYSSNIFSYAVDNKCEKLLENGKISEAKMEAKNLTNKYDSSFCLGKASYIEKEYKLATESFDISIKEAVHPSDQLQAILFKGIAQRDSKDIKASAITFKYGFESAQLGNTKYMQYEQRFLYQLGTSQALLKDYFEATDSFSKSIRIAANDEERALSFDGLARAYYLNNKAGNAVESGLTATLLYQKVGLLGKYADATIELSRYYFLDKKGTKALSVLDKLERFCIDNGGEYYLAKTLLAQSSLLEKLGKKELSVDKQNKADILMKRLGATDL